MTFQTYYNLVETYIDRRCGYFSKDLGGRRAIEGQSPQKYIP